MPHCSIVFLVSMNEQLPSDDTIGYFGSPGDEPIIGCNSLVCLRCEAMVKHVDARAINQTYPPPRETLEALYYSADPASSPLLDGRPFRSDERTYFCRCDWYSVGSYRSLNFLDQNWACGGHGD